MAVGRMKMSAQRSTCHLNQYSTPNDASSELEFSISILCPAKPWVYPDNWGYLPPVYQCHYWVALKKVNFISLLINETNLKRILVIIINY